MHVTNASRTILAPGDHSTQAPFNLIARTEPIYSYFVYRFIHLYIYIYGCFRDLKQKVRCHIPQTSVILEVLAALLED